MDYARIVADFCDHPERTSTHTADVSALRAALLSSGAAVFHALVDSCGATLASESDPRRARATLLLAEVLSASGSALPSIFNTPGARALAAFFAARLEDQSCLTEVLRGLHAVVTGLGSGCLSADLASTVSATVFANYRAQTHTQPTRLAVSAILGACLEAGASPASIALGAARALLPGERDGRNMRAAFELVARASRAANEAMDFPSDDVRATYDVVSAFFPILYVPHVPAGSGVGQPVTKEEVQKALRSCLSSCPQIAQLAVPFLLDRTESAIGAARADAFVTAAACLRVGGPEAVRVEGASLAWWNAVRDRGTDTINGAKAASNVLAAFAELGVTAEWLEEAVQHLCRASTAPPPDPDDMELGDEVVDAARALLAELVKCPACTKEVAGIAMPFLLKLSKMPESDEKDHKSDAKAAKLTLAAISEGIATAKTNGGEIDFAVLTEAAETLVGFQMYVPAARVTAALPEDKAAALLAILANASACDAIVELARSHPVLVALRGVPLLKGASLATVAAVGGPVFAASIAAAEIAGDVGVLSSVVLAGDNSCRASVAEETVPRLLLSLASKTSIQEADVVSLRKMCTAVCSSLDDERQAKLMRRVASFVTSPGLQKVAALSLLSACSLANAPIARDTVLPVVLPSLATSNDNYELEALAAILGKHTDNPEVIRQIVNAVLESGNMLAMGYVSRVLLLIAAPDSSRVTNAMCARIISGQDSALSAKCVGIIARQPSESEPSAVAGYEKRAFDALYEPLSAGGNLTALPAKLRGALARVLSFAPADCVKAPCIVLINAILDDQEADQIDYDAALAAAANTARAPHGASMAGTCARIAALAVRHKQAVIRAAALETLTKLRKEIPEAQTLVFHREVAEAIVPCLDDLKRAVRQKAVRCRNAWMSF